jgi:hypothetical protein
LCLLGRTTRGVLSLASNLTRLVGCLASHLLGLPGGLTRRLLGRCPILAGPVFHSLGGLYHVADDYTSVATRTLDVRKVHAPLLRLTAGRVRGLDLTLAPDLIRVHTGDVLLRLVDAVLHGGVVVHQLLKKCLERFLPSPRYLVRQALQCGAVLAYVLFEHLGRITKVLLSQVHRPLLYLTPGFLDALV